MNDLRMGHRPGQRYIKATLKICYVVASKMSINISTTKKVKLKKGQLAKYFFHFDAAWGDWHMKISG